MSFRNDFGIAFAEDNKDMSDGRWRFDSRKPKWAVDVKVDPPRLRIVTMDGGTKFVLQQPPATPNTAIETLFQQEHKMPFPPAFLCFFYVTDVPPGHSADVGKYQNNILDMNYNNISLGQEALFATVDDTNFYIKHAAKTNVDFGQGPSTFSGSDFKVRLRFEILNLRAVYLGRNPIF